MAIWNIKLRVKYKCCAHSRVKPLFHWWSCRYNKYNTNPCMFEKTYKCCFNIDRKLCGLVVRKRTPVLKVLYFRQINFRMKTSKCIVLLSCLMKSTLNNSIENRTHQILPSQDTMVSVCMLPKLFQSSILLLRVCTHPLLSPCCFLLNCFSKLLLKCW